MTGKICQIWSTDVGLATCPVQPAFFLVQSTALHGGLRSHARKKVATERDIACLVTKRVCATRGHDAPRPFHALAFTEGRQKVNILNVIRI